MPKMLSRDNCIGCNSTRIVELSGGHFRDEPLHSFIVNDPGGAAPMAHLESERWSFVRCADCKLKFHRCILSPETNEVRYSEWMNEESIREFERLHGTNSEQGFASVQHILRLKKLGVKRLLDFGCGFGSFIDMCSHFGLDAVGVDRSSARRQGAGSPIYAELDAIEGKFDAITMFEVLEHLDDPMGVLKELKARLNPGGLLVIEVPDTSGVTGINSRTEYYKIHPLDHFNAFTPETLVAFVESAGFTPIRKDPAFVTTSPVRLAKDVAKAFLKQDKTQRYFRLR